MKLAALLAPALLLAGCTTETAPRPARAAPVPIPITYRTVGLERVIGRTARELVADFGQPDADITEGAGRKLQFGSRICVLDAYLYPPANGRGDAAVTYIDARQRDGSTIDRASCVAALARREGGK